jgi:hypothetical protein
VKEKSLDNRWKITPDRQKIFLFEAQTERNNLFVDV